ncbi:hypothetical protein SSYM_1055 [Serratia symbiotica str. Tucson]|uniref:Uncharacterized protein n=2 Tax=Serratia symbiotica TaxID=138074 RepID=E9CLE3_9GAMM|nr:hypothetical protein SSYM_1055 [Serratia symbiotica str. Tucson]BBI91179.1 uncharacterized protein SSYIS1_02370 [Serratia symbiotica]
MQWQGALKDSPVVIGYIKLSLEQGEGMRITIKAR